MAVSLFRPKSLLPTEHSTPRPRLSDICKVTSSLVFTSHCTPTRPRKLRDPRVYSSLHRFRPLPSVPTDFVCKTDGFTSAKAMKSRKTRSVAQLPPSNSHISVSFTKLDIADAVGIRTPFRSERHRSESTAKPPAAAPVLPKCEATHVRRISRKGRKLPPRRPVSGLEDSFGPW